LLQLIGKTNQFLLLFGDLLQCIAGFLYQRPGIPVGVTMKLKSDLIDIGCDRFDLANQIPGNVAKFKNRFELIESTQVHQDKIALQSINSDSKLRSD
jgi:hypothetical protein